MRLICEIFTTAFIGLILVFGLLVIKDGSMLISDDNAKRIWRITYKK